MSYVDALLYVSMINIVVGILLSDDTEQVSLANQMLSITLMA